jgi:hypothetical protein
MQPENPVIPGHEQLVFGGSQPEYFNLPAIRLDSREGEVITRWKPSAEELALLNDGGSLFLHVWTFGRSLQPINLYAGTPEQVEDSIQTGTSIRYIELVREEVALASEKSQ